MTERLITLCIAIFVLVVAPVAIDAAGQAQNQGQQEPQEPPTQEEEEEVAIPSYALSSVPGMNVSQTSMGDSVSGGRMIG